MGGVAEKMAPTKIGVQWFRAFGSGGFVLAETTRSFSTEQGSGADEGNAARALPCNQHWTAAMRTSSASAVGRSDWGRTVSEPAGRSTLFSKLLIRSSRTAINGLQDQSHQVAPFTELLAETTDQTNKKNGAAIDDGQSTAKGQETKGIHDWRRGLHRALLAAVLCLIAWFSMSNELQTAFYSVRKLQEQRAAETGTKNAALLGAGGMCVGAAAAPLKKQEK